MGVANTRRTAARIAGIAMGVLGTSVLLAAASVWDGVYTEEQASRGKALYDKECASCHLDTLQGDGLAPGLVGDAFTYRWQDGPVSDVFIVIKTTMPADRPSDLQDQEYADIIAYLLKKNKYPSGSTELSKNQADLKDIGFKKSGDNQSRALPLISRQSLRLVRQYLFWRAPRA